MAVVKKFKPSAMCHLNRLSSFGKSIELFSVIGVTRATILPDLTGIIIDNEKPLLRRALRLPWKPSEMPRTAINAIVSDLN